MRQEAGIAGMVAWVVRKIGIAIGSLVAAWLVLWLVGSFLPVPLASGLLTIVLGGLIYRDIIRRPAQRG